MEVFPTEAVLPSALEGWGMHVGEARAIAVVLGPSCTADTHTRI